MVFLIQKPSILSLARSRDGRDYIAEYDIIYDRNEKSP